MNEQKCVWSEERADLAVKNVLQLGIDLITKKIPGQTFVYMTGTGKDAKPVGPEVSKERILSVFNWIIAQTKGFSIPLLVNFRHGDAPTIALGMIHAFSSDLSNELYGLEEFGVHVPRFKFQYHNGLDNLDGLGSPLMLISSISRKQWKMDHSLDGIKIINIHGVSQQPVRTILLTKIPS